MSWWERPWGLDIWFGFVAGALFAIGINGGDSAAAWLLVVAPLLVAMILVARSWKGFGERAAWTALGFAVSVGLAAAWTRITYEPVADCIIFCPEAGTVAGWVVLEASVLFLIGVAVGALAQALRPRAIRE